MNQLTLSLAGGLCNAPLWFALPRKRRVSKGRIAFAPWQQLTLRLPIRKLIRNASHFIWTRPDGKQFVCRTIRQLVARVMDWDGALLRGLLPTAKRLKTSKR
ncbi:hypothetical protein OR16_34693 [Cupriavidus basilensis OR16]|uniref:Uncharacterized protein n=1 Tax=Cupriavidus basilensis OR16 TaxID=1127483 RepID=H1SF37_9BURK|nr:hypothetical protein [Cupriavidus basilensis]EHP38862.1 hypothetical protein OR16_34693 [Cupriavidus basilensis OR16]